MDIKNLARTTFFVNIMLLDEKYYQKILAVLAPLRSSLIIVPEAVSNTLTKVPWKLFTEFSIKFLVSIT